MNDYEAKAQKFLEKTGTEFSCEFLRHGPFFNDDKNTERDIYEITLKRGSRVWSFEFGQSVKNSELGIGPTVYDVLACLTKWNPGSFEEFCADYGYDTDSINAKRIYDAVVQEWLQVSKMFNEKELEELRGIE